MANGDGKFQGQGTEAGFYAAVSARYGGADISKVPTEKLPTVGLGSKGVNFIYAQSLANDKTGKFNLHVVTEGPAPGQTGVTYAGADSKLGKKMAQQEKFGFSPKTTPT